MLQNKAEVLPEKTFNMRNHILAALTAAGVCLPPAAGILLAQGPPGDAQRHAELVRKFDKDGDGRLSKEEIAAVKEKKGRAGGNPLERQSQGAGAEKPHQETPLKNDERIQRLLERFDKDGNGKLDYDEMSALRGEIKASRQPQRKSEKS